MRKENKNKKIILAIALAAMAFTAGCGNEGGIKSADRTANGKTEIEKVLEERIAEDGSQAQNDAGTQDAQDAQGDQKTQDAQNENGKDDQTNDQTNGVLDNTDQGAKNTETSGSVDVDLASMSGTVVYSQVYDMMCNSDAYVGKMIRMAGNYSYYYDEASGNDYHACIIQDATACCAQGIEFEPVKGFTDEASRPAESEVITVTGVFDTYIDGEMMYCTLRNADVEE